MGNQAVTLYLAEALLNYEQHLPEGNAVLYLPEAHDGRLVGLLLAGEAVLASELEMLEAVEV